MFAMGDLAEKIRIGFPGKKVVVLGDIVADQFLHGAISRVSREAPVFILRHEHTETRPGAAANAAANIASLGGEPSLVGIIGDDPNGGSLTAVLSRAGVEAESVIVDREFSTTTKVRVLGGQHYASRKQVIRIDYENTQPLSPEVEDRLQKKLDTAAERANAIVISDYGYGVASEAMVAAAKELSRRRDIPLVVDSRHRLGMFPGATAATPNQEEAEELLGRLFQEEDSEILREQLGFDCLVVTLGSRGLVLAEKGRGVVAMKAVGGDQPVDVTGAGDTVIAVYALGLGAGLSHREAATAANHAGGVVVMKRGTATVTLDELIGSITTHLQEPFSAATSSES